MQEYKILVVDDEEDFINSLSERLEMREMKASVAMDGEEALKKFEEEEPEVMVLDLKMPGLHGIDVLKKVKKAYPNTQVIILTGHGSEKDMDAAKKIGAFAYLEKPVEMDTLVATMNMAHKHWRKVKNSVDTAFMGASLSSAGELELAQQFMNEEKNKK
jgi:DNA-binding NtrC family response regulator